MTHDDASKSHNIFETASRLEKERREKQIKKQAPPPTAEPAQNTVLSTIFQRCKQLHNEIAESLNQAFKNGGITSIQLRTYVSRPQNFSEKDWQQIEEQKRENEAMLLNLKKNFEAKKAEEETLRPQSKPENTDEEPPSHPLPSGEQPLTKPPTPHPKKPRIMTRRQWIGM
jgi:hypothetical protein